MLRHFFPMGSGGERGSVSGFRLAERAQICLNVAADATQFAGEMSCLVSGTWKVRSWSC